MSGFLKRKEVDTVWWKHGPTWCLPTVSQKCFLFCFPPSVSDGGRCYLRRAGESSSCLSSRNPDEETGPAVIPRSGDQRDDPGSFFPDVFLDLCGCCLGTAGETTGNVPGSFLRCHGNCQGGGSVSSAEWEPLNEIVRRPRRGEN